MIHPLKAFSALCPSSIPDLGSVSNPCSHEPAASSTHHQQVQSSQNLWICLIQVWWQLHTHTDTANTLIKASADAACTETFSVFVRLFFVSAHTAPLLVYTCLTELAAKTKKVKQKKAANVCEYGGICKDITAGRISSHGIGTQTYTHANTVHTASHRDPVSAAHSMTGGHMQNTYTHTQIIYAHRERNKHPSSYVLQHARVQPLWTESLNHQS